MILTLSTRNTLKGFKMALNGIYGIYFWQFDLFIKNGAPSCPSGPPAVLRCGLKRQRLGSDATQTKLIISGHTAFDLSWISQRHREYPLDTGDFGRSIGVI